MQVDKGGGGVKPVPVGEVLLEVAGVLGKDMSRWRQMVEESQRRMRGPGGRRFGGARGPGGGLQALATALPQQAGTQAGVAAPAPFMPGAPAELPGGIELPPPVPLGGIYGPPRSRKPYKDIDVPKVRR
jgi:hypothetical protein